MEDSRWLDSTCGTNLPTCTRNGTLDMVEYPIEGSEMNNGAVTHLQEPQENFSHSLWGGWREVL